MSQPDTEQPLPLRALLDRRCVGLLLLGFSAGLPLLLIFGTLSVWLREAGVDRAAVTFFSWAALGYSFKFVWAPLVDRLPVPWLTAALGRRRAWLLCAQLALMAAIWLTSSTDPGASLVWTAAGAVLIGFAAATQDIVIDALRIECAPPRWQSMLAASYIAGYRIGMITSGAGALWLASELALEPSGYSYEAWRTTYRVMAAAMLVGVATTLWMHEPERAEDLDSGGRAGQSLPVLGAFVLCALGFALVFAYAGTALETLYVALLGANAHGPLAGFTAAALRLLLAVAAAALLARLCVRAGVISGPEIHTMYAAPVLAFIERHGASAVVVLALIASYRIADIVMGSVANVFYLDMGYLKTEIATYSKLWGLLATIAGGFLGGVASARYGVGRVLVAGAALAALSNLLFAWLATLPPDVRLLATIIVADNLSAGLAGAAFVAYLSSLTQVSFTASQYALFTSLMTLLPKLLAGYSGSMVNALGYPVFFVSTALMGLPVLALSIHLTRSRR